MTKGDLYKKVIFWFETQMPFAQSELHFRNTYELIVAVILSAQCTDKRVNLVTPKFFLRFPEPAILAEAETDEIFEKIKSISYPNNKSKHLQGMAQKLMSDFGGCVPNEVLSLMQLPGVGRKTANVVASVAFGQARMAVDTHVFRVANRIGLCTHAKTPLEVEKQLVRYIPQEKIGKAHHWLILHGRYVCMARKPKCESCGLSSYCNFYKKQVEK